MRNDYMLKWIGFYNIHSGVNLKIKTRNDQDPSFRGLSLEFLQ